MKRICVATLLLLLISSCQSYQSYVDNKGFKQGMLQLLCSNELCSDFVDIEGTKERKVLLVTNTIYDYKDMISMLISQHGNLCLLADGQSPRIIKNKVVEEIAKKIGSTYVVRYELIATKAYRFNQIEKKVEFLENIDEEIDYRYFFFVHKKYAKECFDLRKL